MSSFTEAKIGEIGGREGGERGMSCQ